ncbi:hypothetical protein GCM10010983_44060 [Caulobacter rhizosphaerae]|nr:hypothetical protein GCM10010983_44060 [Caulobacter rhizosphaerae]
MTKFRLQKAPSAQNAVALIAETLEQTVDNILSFRDGGTPPSYEPTRALAPTLMEEGNLAWCLAQCDPIKWDLQKTINKELLHSLSGYRNLIEAKWYRRPAKVQYEGHGLSVPLQPLGVWSDGKQLFVDWLQPWKHKGMTPRQLDILYTLHRHRFLIGSYFDAEFRCVEFQVPENEDSRKLNLEFGTFSELSDDELGQELKKLLAAIEVASKVPRKPKVRKADEDQPDLPFSP